jgi:hypothetical protein
MSIRVEKCASAVRQCWRAGPQKKRVIGIVVRRVAETDAAAAVVIVVAAVAATVETVVETDAAAVVATAGIEDSPHPVRNLTPQPPLHFVAEGESRGCWRDIQHPHPVRNLTPNPLSTSWQRGSPEDGGGIYSTLTL